MGGNKRKQFQDRPLENALYLWFKWRRWSIWPFVANPFEEVEANGVKSVLNIPVVVDTAPQVADIGVKEKQLWEPVLRTSSSRWKQMVAACRVVMPSSTTRYRFDGSYDDADDDDDR